MFNIAFKKNKQLFCNYALGQFFHIFYNKYYVLKGITYKIVWSYDDHGHLGMDI